MVNVEFDDSVPKDLVPAVQKLHNEFDWLYPKWVQSVTYSYKALKQDGDTTVAENYTSYPYRRIGVVFYNNFLMSKERYRKEVFLHEVLHSFTGIFAIPILDTIERLIKDDDCKQIILQEMIEKIEAFTQDMAWSFLNRPVDNKTKK